MLRISYELNSALEYRQKHRTFGNIDTTIRPLSITEIVGHEMDRVFTTESFRKIFERDDVFFTSMNK